jgi:hypothetical protein
MSLWIYVYPEGHIRIHIVVRVHIPFAHALLGNGSYDRVRTKGLVVSRDTGQYSRVAQSGSWRLHIKGDPVGTYIRHRPKHVGRRLVALEEQGLPVTVV